MKQELSPKALEHARTFLSSLFMGLRTAQIHDPTNAAFKNAQDNVLSSARDLYSSTNGFSVKFVEGSVFVNGTRMRLDGGAFSAMRSLRHLLEGQGMGGVQMETPPTAQSIKTLLLLFSGTGEKATAEDVKRADIGLLGIQQFAEDRKELRVDRRIFAVQSYAKLILALREQIERAEAASEFSFTVNARNPRMRVVRILQDLVELCGDRADFVLRLALNDHGAEKEALYGVNTALLAITMGHALGLERSDVADLGVGAVFHPIGMRLVPVGDRIEMQHMVASLARILQESGVGRSADLRAIVVAECLVDQNAGPPHVYSRIVRVAAAFMGQYLGFPTGQPQDPLVVLESMLQDDSGFLDARCVDLLINVLRAYPAGADVALDSGAMAQVVTQVGGSRWDRPLVRAHGETSNLDLMSKDGGRFVDRIVGTCRFAGVETAAPSLEAPADTDEGPAPAGMTDTADTQDVG